MRIRKKSPNHELTDVEHRFLENVRSAKAGFHLHESHDIRKSFSMIDLNEEDLKLIQALQSIMDEHLEQITDAFYSTILDIDHLRATIENHTTIERLKITLKDHLFDMFSGVIDEGFIEKRYKIASAHVRIGLEPKWYMGAFQNLQNSIIDVIQNTFSSKSLTVRIHKAVAKLLNIEQQIVLDAYETQNLHIKEEQYEKAKQELRRHIGTMSGDLAALAQQTSASVEQLVAGGIEISRSFEHSIANSESTQSMASIGKGRINRLNQIVSDVFRGMNEMNRLVNDLGQSFDQIKGIAAIVQEIAAQTHLLSFNASIEAARAGSSGAGFSVVASEVKKLSEDTKQAVDHIQTLIETSAAWMKDVVRALDVVSGQIADAQTEAASSDQLFEAIYESMNQNIRELQTNKQDLRSFVQVIEEIGTATQKVSQSAEKLNDQTLRQF